jgi:hypothetical protein
LGKGSLPDAAVRERSKQFEIKIVQLKSALNRVEKKDFWETVLAGCSLESRIAGDGHPAAEHANVRFYDWLPDLQQERTERLDKLATENLSPLGRASRTIAITEEFLVREAKEWIAIYKKAAEEFKSPEILLPPWINRFRCAIMSYVGYGLLSAKDTIEISLRTNGETSNPPGFGVYKIVASHLLTTVNSKLRVLETGALARPATPGNIWGSGEPHDDTTAVDVSDECEVLLPAAVVPDDVGADSIESPPGTSRVEPADQLRTRADTASIQGVPLTAEEPTLKTEQADRELGITEPGPALAHGLERSEQPIDHNRAPEEKQPPVAALAASTEAPDLEERKSLYDAFKRAYKDAGLKMSETMLAKLVNRRTHGESAIYRTRTPDIRAGTSRSAQRRRTGSVAGVLWLAPGWLRMDCAWGLHRMGGERSHLS